MKQLDVLFICDGAAWTAQCLQYDIAAQGESLKDAQRAFEYMLSVEAAYLAEQKLTLDSLPAAPQWYWSKYQEAKNDRHVWICYSCRKARQENR